MFFKIISFFLFLLCTEIAIGNTLNSDISPLFEKAKSGNPVDELAYAKAIYPSSKNEAFKWARKAADQGLAEAWFWMGTNSSESDSVYYYSKAAKLSYPKAFGVLIDYYMMSGKTANFTKAKEFSDLAQEKRIQIGLSSDDSMEKRETINHCFEAGKPNIPTRDLPTQREASEFQKKDCDIYHYGIGVPKDMVKYRKCLLAQKEIDNTSLAEVYANGWGVSRNPNLALALICHADNLAPAELYGTVKTLYETRQLKTLPKEFDFCEHITSGANMGLCAARDEKISKAKRSEILNQIASKWPERDRLAFEELQNTANAFFEEHATSELDMSGTARGAIALGEKNSMQEDFLKSIKLFEKGELPTNSNFKHADQELNEIYNKLIHSQFSDQTGTLSKEGFIATQRKWIVYRDTWVKFGTSHYSKTKPDVWKTWITEKRTNQLKDILKAM